MKQQTTIFSLALALVPLAAFADIKPASLFTDNMVIQRETKAPVWGWADPGETVSVTGSWGGSATATADASGKWRVDLETPPAGGPHTITLEGKNKLVVDNVLSGDVWLCSGQSNMEWPVAKAKNPEEEAQGADHPRIRHFRVQKNASPDPADDCTGQWVVCAPDTVKDFSATAYFTGRELEKALDVPIGLLVSSWGGTCVEAWTDGTEQTADPIAAKRKAELDAKAGKYSPETAAAAHERKLKLWEEQVAAAKAANKRPPRRPLPPQDPRSSQKYPGRLYNGMIVPLLPYAIKGAVWYQGESNAQALRAAGAKRDKDAAGSAEAWEMARHYRVQLDRMVRNWRKAWGSEFPFFAVQLPDFRAPQKNPVENSDAWPLIRESVVHVAENTPGVFTATMLGLGEEKNIHPSDKQGVGQRMASTILNKTYGKDTPTTPFLVSSAIEGDKIMLEFAFTGSGLEAAGEKTGGFAIAGEDKNFVWAEAEILPDGGGKRVAVSSPQIKNPVAVRYAWADNPATANLQSKEGFPASPFRTDNWDLGETPPEPSAP
jgi:sialate O-acetylesterase